MRAGRSAAGARVASASPPGPVPGRSTAGVILLLALLAPAASAQNPVLRGELLDRDGRAANGVRVLIVGHPPEVVVRDGGLFAHPLSGDPSEVTVRVVGEPGVGVLFPPGGRLSVPRDPNAVVTVVVGASIDEAVRERIETDLRAIRETLALRGVPEDRIEAAVAAEMQGLVARLEEITRGAVEGAVAGAEQVELRERINRHLSAYLRAAGDLVRVFGLIDPDQEMGASRFQALYRTAEQYSNAYGTVDGELAAVPPSLERAWPGEPGAAARRELEFVLELIETGFHRGVLDLTQPLGVIQRNYLAGPRPGRSELREARRQVSEAGPALADALVRLETQVASLFAGLGLAAPGT